jgi:hypothetical protein
MATKTPVPAEPETPGKPEREPEMPGSPEKPGREIIGPPTDPQKPDVHQPEVPRPTPPDQPEPKPPIVTRAR